MFTISEISKTLRIAPHPPLDQKASSPTTTELKFPVSSKMVYFAINPVCIVVKVKVPLTNPKAQRG
jgi:hypothetical protein